MPDHFQVEGWGSAQVCLEGKCLLLFVPAAEEPLNGQCARTELHRYVGVFEAARRELKSGVKAVTIVPARIEDASFTGAGGLDPA